jgi:protein-L-isoaspartate O-methyltransferase
MFVKDAANPYADEAQVQACSNYIYHRYFCLISPPNVQPIGHNATISAPHMHGVGLDVLESVIPQQGAKVLDIGAGSGFATSHRICIPIFLHLTKRSTGM